MSICGNMDTNILNSKKNEFNYTLGSVTATINGEKKQRFVYRFDGLKKNYVQRVYMFAEMD